LNFCHPVTTLVWVFLDTSARILLVPLGSCTFLPDLHSTSVASQLLVFAACRNLRFDILYQRRPTLLEIQKRCLGVHQRLFYTGCFGGLPSSLATVNMTRQHPFNLGCQASRNRQALVFGCLGHYDGNFSVLASSILICSPFCGFSTLGLCRLPQSPL
jgi:hypothetical protein